MIDLNLIKRNKTTKELLEFGIINLDKSSGPTSFNISDFVRKKLNLRKTSHFGTLDPQVTGVLPIALNRACKLTGYFLGEDKEYVGIMRIHEEKTLEELKKLIDEKFMGKINQLPPLKSRVKRELREREIKKFDLLEKDGMDILFRVECQGGTYIRKLIDDLGKEVGGAHMLELRRVRAGIFRENSQTYPSVKLYDFEKAVQQYQEGNDLALREMIIPAEIISEVYPPMEIKPDNLKQILTGKPVYKKDLKADDGWKKESMISVFCEDKFIGMYQVMRGKEIFATSKFVMQDIQG